MTRKLKVLTIVGTRPEIIKLSRVLTALDRLTDHMIVHTGQNYDYELNQIFFEQLGLRKPDHFLDAAADTGTQTVANVIAKTDALLTEIDRPDALLVLGDTNSCMAAYAAKRHKIPVFHMEAGNRCFDERVPEEINRKIIDHISDVNLVYTDHARQYLLNEGLDPARIIKTGSPMAEILFHYQDEIAASQVLEELDITPQGYFLASLHREENVDCPERLRTLIDALSSLAQDYGRPVIFSAHPRTRKRLEAMPDWQEHNEHIRFMKPLGFFDYVHLQQHAYCVLSDSGTITEESSLLGFPAIMLRQAHERPEGMDEAAVIMTDPERVSQAVDIAVQQADNDEMPPLKTVKDYQNENVSTKVVRLITSYTGYVERVVWRNYT